MRTTTLLKRVSSVYTGTTPPTSEDLFYSAEDVSWYTPGDISSEDIELEESSKFISQIYFNRSNISLFPAGSSLLVGIGASVGKVGITTKDCYSNQQINAIVFDETTILPKFGTYWLFDKRYEINAKTPSVTLPIFNQSKVRQLEITFPSIMEQTHVVEFLDSKSNIIGRQVSLLMKKRDCYLRLKTSIISRAVTRGLNENVKLKNSGIEWIGRFPEHWILMRGKDVLQVISGYPANSNLFTLDTTCIPLVRIRDINSFETEIHYDGDYPKWAELANGDLLIGMDGDFNVCRWKGNRALLNQRVCKIESKAMNTQYLAYILPFPLLELNSQTNSTTVKHLSVYGINGLYLPIPPLSEQQAIASYLDDKCAKIDSAIANIDKQIDALKRLKRALINEVVTGKREV